MTVAYTDIFAYLCVTKPDKGSTVGKRKRSTTNIITPMAKIDNYNFAGKKAIVRVDFNVPLDENGHITDDTRIRGALPTLKKILADGGSLILMSHMGFWAVT